MRRALALGLLLLAVPLTGCIGNGGDDLDTQAAQARAALPGPGAEVYERTGDWSLPLVPGLYPILDGLLVELPSHDGTLLTAGVFLPEIEGCDWSAGDLPERCRLPVVVDPSPYYGMALPGNPVVGGLREDPVDQRASRLGRFLIETLVPQGYAVVQASVRGTGYSHGCADLGGLDEQGDVDAFVTHFGTEPWSNGNVGLIGRSYDGTLAFAGAQFGNPHLKTIVPISGISNWEELYYRNGSAEFRSPILGTLFTLIGLTAQNQTAEGIAEQACPATLEHPVFGTTGWLNGGGDALGTMPAYWAVRDYVPRILENYEGSVWIIQGLQDWNVKPSQSFPLSEELRAKGLDVKVWAGQWPHAYPDRVSEHDHLRFDWAQTLLNWFDRYLRGIEADTGPWVETEDNHGNWRAANAWPADTLTWQTLHVNDEGLAPEAGAGGEHPLADPAVTEMLLGDTPLSALTFASEPFAEATRIAGLPRLHLTVTPTGTGGALYAELFTVDGEERTQVGHAQMDLRYHAGGREQQVVVPGEPIVARMAFYPLDVLVPAGHALELVVRQSNFGEASEPLPSSHQEPVLVHTGEGSTLALPLAPVEDVHYVTEGVDPASLWP